MFVQMLNSLVLRGASVLRDGQVVGARLGISYLAAMQPPVTPVTSLRPSDSEPVSDSDTRSKRADHLRASNASANRAGRSVCLAGVLSSSLRTPARAIPSGWSRARGGSCLTAVLSADHRVAAMTTGGEIFLAVQPAAGPGSLEAIRRLSGAKPAGRTPPAAWRGWGS